MTIDLPLWLEYTKALSTPVVAVIAAVITGQIAYRQWRTANDKLVLDLFQKRLECYEALTSAVLDLPRVDWNDASLSPLQALARARYKAKFLFGSDVNDYLNDLWASLIRLRRLRRLMQRAEDSELEALGEEEMALSEKFEQFPDRIDPLMTPYLRMDQKLSQYRDPPWSSFYRTLLIRRQSETNN